MAESTVDGRGTAGRRARGTGGTVLVGAVLIGLGAVLLLGEFDVLDSREVLRRAWPAIPLGAGLWWLAVGPRLGGALLTGIGLFWAAAANDLLPTDAGRLVWPTLLVILGVLVLLSARRVSTVGGAGGDTQVTVFDDRDWTANADQLSGTTLITVFGDCDLRVTGRPSDGEVHLTTWCVFGDVDIEVPTGWEVRDATTTVFGGSSLPREVPAPDAPRLILSGMCVFGDVKVRTSPDL